MARLLASVTGTVEVQGACTFARATVDELRLDTWDPPGHVLGTATESTAVETALEARVRWNRPLLLIEGQPILRERYGDVSIEDEMVAGQFRTMKFQALGKSWTFFDTVEPATGLYAPCAAAPAAATTPLRRAWGNRRVELRFAAGATAAHLQELLAYGGLTFHKSNKGDTLLTAQIDCVDLSIQISDIPLCFSLQPFQGFRRGEIVRALAESIGIPAEKIFVPLGGLVTKPVLLNNVSLIPFIAEFGEVENWFPHFDDDGNLVVEEIVLKTEQPDFIHDARNGDIDYGTFEEDLPERPPSRYYVTASFPIKNTGVLDNPLAKTEKTVTSEFGFYNPLVVKVRPSGLPSVAQLPDGGVVQYRAFPAEEFMEIGRVETERTTLDGTLAYEVVRTWGMYNPLVRDPNFDSVPAGTSYNGAYGDHSFHAYEIESLMVVVEEITENRLDEFGTLLGTDVTTQKWYAPKRGILYNTPRTDPKNFPAASPPCYIFPDSKGVTARQVAIEAFQVVERTTRDIQYDSAGRIAKEISRRYRITDAQSRCDIISDPALPPNSSPPPPTTSDPLPDHTGGISLRMQISGPTRREGDRFFFQLTLPGYVDEYFANNFGVHVHAISFPSATEIGLPVLQYVPRNAAGFRPLPGGEGIVAQYSPGQIIDPTATPPKMTAEIFVDVPHAPPLILSEGPGVHRNLFDGTIQLCVLGKFEYLTGLFTTIPTDFFPKGFTAYEPGSWPTRGI